MLWGAGIANKLLAPLVPPLWSAILTALIFMALRDSLLRRPNALRRTVVVSLVQFVHFCEGVFSAKHQSFTASM